MTLTLQSLYAIADADVAAAAGWRLDDLAAAYLAGGARLLQIRAKRLGSGELGQVVDAILQGARQVGATVLVNDRLDVAMLAGAAGVHVGQTDLHPGAVRRLAGPDFYIGFSSHTRAQVDEARRLPIDYLAVGPVFGTVTKKTRYEAVGLELVGYAAAGAGRRLPVVAIGGISLDRAQRVLDAGADAVAVVSDLLATGEPAERVAAYLARLKPPSR